MRFILVASLATAFWQMSPAAILLVSFISAAALATAAQFLFGRRSPARCPKPPAANSPRSDDGKAAAPRSDERMNNW